MGRAWADAAAICADTREAQITSASCERCRGANQTHASPRVCSSHRLSRPSALECAPPPYPSSSPSIQLHRTLRKATGGMVWPRPFTVPSPAYAAIVAPPFALVWAELMRGGCIRMTSSGTPKCSAISQHSESPASIASHGSMRRAPANSSASRSNLNAR